MEQAINKIELRNLNIDDYFELKKSMQASYPDMEQNAYWNKKDIEKLLDTFPEGQLVILADDVVVGSALSLIVDEEQALSVHTYREITGQATFSTHNPKGDVLYGIDVFIHPDYRGMRLGRRLYDARKEICEQLNLKSIVFAGRMPTYSEYADELTPKEYLNKVKSKEIFDPVLSFQMANDFHIVRLLRNYLLGDIKSQEYAVLLEWNNIFYEKNIQLLNTRKSVVRLGLIQWQMRLFKDLDEFFDQAEFFVKSVSDYQSDFALFPELFTAPLMADYNHLSPADSIRELAGYTDEVHKRFQELAISYNINIITGSMPYLDEDGSLYNVGFLCKRDGKSEMYAKIHITPAERQYWGMKGGSEIKVYDTDCGKIGIMVCYDVEFPELSRLLGDEGMDILFVPFMTDTQNGYIRVRNCAAARAIENECYVAITGNIGNLPKVNNMDIQYAQAAVLTPSDFAFPANAVKGEATPNTEMTLMVDVDLDLLRELNEYGSVQVKKDRRNDLYQTVKLKKS